MVNKVFALLRHRGGRGDGAAARRRRPARHAHARGGDGGGAAAPVHAVSRVPRGSRRHPRPAPHPPAVRRAAQRRPRPDDDRVAAAARRTSSPRPSRSRSCSASCAGRTRTWRSSSTSTARPPASSRSRTCWRRSSARSTTSSTGPTSRSCACRKDRVRVAGSFPIDEFNERFGCALSDEDYNTVGGYVFGELGRAPQEGDRVEISGLRFTVHGVDGARIVTVDVEIRPKTGPRRAGHRGPDGRPGRRRGRRRHPHVMGRCGASPRRYPPSRAAQRAECARNTRGPCPVARSVRLPRVLIVGV